MDSTIRTIKVYTTPVSITTTDTCVVENGIKKVSGVRDDERQQRLRIQLVLGW